MKYKKKPVVVEAFQYDGDLKEEDGKYDVPDWAVEAHEKGIMYYDQSELFINTLEGAHHASVGDYIIQGVKGELYPCKPDIFEATYEKLDNRQLSTVRRGSVSRKTTEIANETLKELGCDLCQADDASIVDWDNDTICTVDDFAKVFLDKVIEKLKFGGRL